MRLAGKIALGGIIIALVGTGVGLALGSGLTREDRVSAGEAPRAVVLERREQPVEASPREEVAMVSTRPAPSAPASVERAPRPAPTRELERGRDARGGLRVRRIEVATGIEAREPVGASDPIPAYLPEEVSKKLPLYQRFAVRMIVEVHRTADQNEVHPAALRALALGRTLGSRA